MAKFKNGKVKTSDGTIIHYWENKLHSWDGPALIPQGDTKQGEYYIFGIKKTKEEWLEAKKDQTGLPFYKSSTFKGDRY